MKSLWSHAEATRLVTELSATGVAADLAERIHTSRLLGREPRLVLHGGGNTSLKTRVPDPLFGATEPLEVLHVKGSGRDLATIDARGLPAVRLEPLRRSRILAALDDEAMVNFLRGNLLDSDAPTPSVETLLHAFLPHPFVDHTHALPILWLADQPDGEARVREVFGGRVGCVPYVMPGFALAKAAAEVFERDPTVEGLVLLKHGLFTFGATARESYERTVEFVTRAEEHVALAAGRARPVAISRPSGAVAPLAEVAPIVRGALASAAGRDDVSRFPQRWILNFRTGPETLRLLGDPELPRLVAAGPATPDHVIRTKALPLALPAAPGAGELKEFAAAARDAVERYASDYRAYFERHNLRHRGTKTMLDPTPRVVLVPGLGLFGVGPSAREAAVVADLAETWVETVLGAERLGRFEPIGESDQFDMEYWSLEQAKLGRGGEKPLARQVVLITGGAGAIGRAVGRAFAAEGAEVVLVDLDAKQAGIVAREAGPRALGVAADVTDPAAVWAAFDRACETFGGVDIIVSNAGAAWAGAMATLPDETLRKSFELNFFSHQHVAQNAVRVLRAQGTGGALLFNASKQAVNPGPDFGAYGIPKAATLALARQYALEHGRDGIRVNAVNADRIRSGLLTEDMIASRAQARGVSAGDYLAGNLLGQEVTAEDVAQAFVHQALARRTTGGVTTVDGGNVAAMLR